MVKRKKRKRKENLAQTRPDLTPMTYQSNALTQDLETDLEEQKNQRYEDITFLKILIHIFIKILVPPEQNKNEIN